MITITPPLGVSTAGAQHSEEQERGENCIGADDADSTSDDERADVRKAFRRNVSTANLLSDSEHLELLEWATKQDGPWSLDLSEYPGPGNTSITLPVSSSATAPNEPYRPVLHGFRCEIFRNEYLAWCAAVQLPETHPDFHRSPNELRGIEVHGGLTYAGSSQRGCLMFDCNHASSDLVPFAAFVGAHNDQRRIGGLGSMAMPASPVVPTQAACSGLPVPNGKRGLAVPGGNPGGGLLGIPSGSTALVLNTRATYKDYYFVRAELERLVEQLLARQSTSTY